MVFLDSTNNMEEHGLTPSSSTITPFCMKATATNVADIRRTDQPHTEKEASNSKIFTSVYYDTSVDVFDSYKMSWEIHL